MSTGISSISTNAPSHKSINSCKLCSKLLPVNYRFIKEFSSSEIKTDHSKFHANQTRIINNITINTSASFDETIVVNSDHEDFLRKCFKSLDNERNFISISTSLKQIASNQHLSLPKISLITDGIPPEWSGLEKLRTQNNYSGRVLCRMCKHDQLVIIDTTGKQLRFNEIILHSAKHLLGTGLYSCNICEYTTNTIEQMQRHHFDQHLDIAPRDAKSHYFTANYLLHKTSILDMIKSCFIFELINCEGKLAKLEKIHESATEFRLSILRKHLGTKKSVQCRSCAKLLTFGVHGYGDWIKQHAQAHLVNKAIWRCVFCDVSKPTLNMIRRHLKTMHPDLILKHISHYQIDESAKFDKETDEMLYECFQRTDDDNEDHQSRIQPYWRELRQKICSSKRIRCGICLKSVLATSNLNKFSLTPVLQHALSHLRSDLPIYTCNLCNEWSVLLRANCSRHFQKCHSDIGASEWNRYLKNNTNKFETEIVAEMKECFDSPTIAFSPKKTSPKLKTTKPKGKIQQFCNELIKNSTNELNRLECKVCSKEIGSGILNRQFRHSVMAHGISHIINLPIYLCKICAFESVTRHKIKQHIRKVHVHELKLKVVDYFCDNREKFKKEILIELKNCFQKC